MRFGRISLRRCRLTNIRECTLEILLACLRSLYAICSSFIASIRLAESLGLTAFLTVEHDAALPGAPPQELSRP